MSQSPSPTVPPMTSPRNTDSELKSLELNDAIPSNWVEKEPSCPSIPSPPEATIPHTTPTEDQNYMDCEGVHYPTSEDKIASNRWSNHAQSQIFSFVKAYENRVNVYECYFIFDIERIISFS